MPRTFFWLGQIINQTLKAIIIPSHIPIPIAVFFPPLPFLAHAIGTLIGAMIALWFSNRSVVLAYVVGVFFLIGGITMVYMLPESPLWFDVFDLTLAYIPMAWVATKIIKK